MAVSTIDALYNGGSEKVTATSTGISVTGTVTADGFQTDTANTTTNLLARNSTNAAVYLQNGGTGDVLHVRSGNMSAGQGDLHLKVANSGDISFYEDTGTTAKFFWDASAESLGIGIAPSKKLTVFGTGVGNATVQIEGEGGADPYINFLTNNTQHWSMGVDDSDSDKFKLSEHSALGTNDYLTVDVTGKVGIGTSSPSAKLQVGSETGRTFTIDQSSANKTQLINDRQIILQSNGGYGTLIKAIGGSGYGHVSFETSNNGEVGRFDSSGHLLVGKTTTALNDAGHQFGEDGFVYHTRTGNIMWLNTLSSSAIAITFAATGTTKGNIAINTSSVSYNTTSDYRLKTDAQPMTGASARVQALNPVNFEWLSDGTRVDGFLAHEAATVVPEAVSGDKDAMQDEEYEVTPAVYEDVVIEAVEAVAEVPAVYDEEGALVSDMVPAVEAQSERTEQNLVTEAVMGTRSVPDYQGIDQSKIVPLLTAALQEALTEIAALKARVTTLEG